MCGFSPHVDGSSTRCPGNPGWLSQPIGPFSGRTSATAAARTFGSVSTRAISRSMNAFQRSTSSVSGPPEKARSCSGSKPSTVASSPRTVRRNRAVPNSSATAVATWATTTARWIAPAARIGGDARAVRQHAEHVDAPRDQDRPQRAQDGGARTSPPRRRPSTRTSSSATSPSRGTSPGASHKSRRSRPQATASAAASDSAVTMALSTRTCPASRTGEAPSAARIARARWWRDARDTCRPATFAHAMKQHEERAGEQRPQHGTGRAEQVVADRLQHDGERRLRTALEVAAARDLGQLLGRADHVDAGLQASDGVEDLRATSASSRARPGQCRRIRAGAAPPGGRRPRRAGSRTRRA